MNAGGELGDAVAERDDLDPGPVARLVIAPLLLSAVWKGAIEPLGGAPLDVAAMRDTHLDVLLTGLAKREGAPS